MILFNLLYSHHTLWIWTFKMCFMKQLLPRNFTEWPRILAFWKREWYFCMQPVHIIHSSSCKLLQRLLFASSKTEHFQITSWAWIVMLQKILRGCSGKNWFSKNLLWFHHEIIILLNRMIPVVNLGQELWCQVFPLPQLSGFFLKKFC